MSEINTMSVHPAFVAWRKIDHRAAFPEEIEVLKSTKTKVYRLIGAGPEKRDVIAKLSKNRKLEIEKTIYEHILPLCSCSFLDFYGWMEEGEYQSWMFVEYARGIEYNMADKGHRMAVARWLGQLHRTKLPEEKIALLPDRSLNCYFEYLLDARKHILDHVKAPDLPEGNAQSLKAIIPVLEKVFGRWEVIASLVGLIPPAFIHGDFSAKNFRIRSLNSEFHLLPFDWEMSGWGVPVIDIANLSLQLQEEELIQYFAAMQLYPSRLNLEEIRLITQFGALLRLVVSVYWATLSFSRKWINTPSGRFIFDQLDDYRIKLNGLHRSLKW